MWHLCGGGGALSGLSLREIVSALESLHVQLHVDRLTTLEPATDLLTLLEALPTPPAKGWELVKLNDHHKFHLSIGKRVLDQELNPQGKIPVYSANVARPFGFVDQELLEDYKNDCVLWGIDGDWITTYMPKNTPFYPTDHCGVLRVIDPNIYAKILRYALHQVGQEQGFCRNLRASLQRVRDLKIPLPPSKSKSKSSAFSLKSSKKSPASMQKLPPLRAKNKKS